MFLGSSLPGTAAGKVYHHYSEAAGVELEHHIKAT
jgi:hypothetical protein